MSTISILPNDILITILNYIGTPEDFLHILLICHEWKNRFHYQDKQLWIQIALNYNITIHSISTNLNDISSTKLQSLRSRNDYKKLFLKSYYNKVIDIKEKHDQLIIQAKIILQSKRDQPIKLQKLINCLFPDIRSFNCNYKCQTMEDNSLLTLACRYNQSKCITLLIETYHANIDICDVGGFTPLMLCTYQGSFNNVLYLLKHKANWKLKGRLRSGSFLIAEHWAAILGYMEIFRYLHAMRIRNMNRNKYLDSNDNQLSNNNNNINNNIDNNNNSYNNNIDNSNNNSYNNNNINNSNNNNSHINNNTLDNNSCYNNIFNSSGEILEMNIDDQSIKSSIDTNNSDNNLTIFVFNTPKSNRNENTSLQYMNATDNDNEELYLPINLIDFEQQQLSITYSLLNETDMNNNNNNNNIIDHNKSNTTTSNVIYNNITHSSYISNTSNSIDFNNNNNNDYNILLNNHELSRDNKYIDRLLSTTTATATNYDHYSNISPIHYNNTTTNTITSTTTNNNINSMSSFCICGQGFIGQMVACDGINCPVEWFHYNCVGLYAKPRGHWYCPHCIMNNTLLESTSLKDTVAVLRSKEDTAEDHSYYCICNRNCFNTPMIACDNDKCLIEWYHFECVGLYNEPTLSSWVCPACSNSKFYEPLVRSSIDIILDTQILKKKKSNKNNKITKKKIC